MNKSSKRYTVQCYWSGSKLSLLEIMCLVSWVTFGAKVNLYTHDNIKKIEDQIPSKIKRYVNILNADIILVHKRKFLFKSKEKSKRKDAFKLLPFSDLFRYEMLRKNGGIWIDLDLVLIRPIPSSILKKHYVFVSERTLKSGAFASIKNSKPINAFISVKKPNSEWSNWIVNKSFKTKIEGFQTYLKVFRESVNKLELDEYVEEPDFVMPINWWEIKNVFKPLEPSECLMTKFGVKGTCENYLKNKKTIGVHLFRAMLRKNDLPYEDKSKIPESSLFGKLINHIEKKSKIIL